MASSEEKKRTFAVSMTNFLDAGCIVGVSVALSTWAAAFHLDAMWVAIIGAITGGTLAGALGALVGGFLTDKFGRTIIYRYNLLLYAFGTLIIVVAQTLPVLMLGILLSGLTIGTGMPASWSYIGEMSSNESRAENVGISQFAWSLGPAVIFLMALVFSFVFPPFDASGALCPAGTYGPFDGTLGIRIIFAILLVISLIAWNLQRQLPESRDWSSKQQDAHQQSFVKLMADALTNPVCVKSIVFLVLVYLSWNLVAGTMGMFMPYLYRAAGGLDETMISLLQTALWVLTAVGSLAIFGKLGDRVSHRLLFGASAFMALAAWLVMLYFGFTLKAGTSDANGWVLWVFVVLWGLSAGFSAQCFFALWSTELFPAQYRGGVQGIMFFLIRVVLGVWGLFVIGGLNVTTPDGFILAAILMIVCLVISLVVGVIWCPNTRGRSLDDIILERYGKL